MGHNLLLEIGLEEIPAHIVIPSQEQLAERIQAFLQENRLPFGEVETFSTPRRLAVLIHSLVEKQNDEKKIVKGPAKHIALSEDGTWTKAAQGFVKGQGLTTDDIYFKEIKGVEYVHVEKFIPGEMTMEIVKHLDKVVTAMTFPVSMHWADYSLRYIRPIHWIVALLDETIIPFTILDVKTGRESSGHRFLGKEISISTASDYEADLKGEYVIANAKQREHLIVSQIQKLADDNGWVIDFDEDLLEEVTNLVE
ncbi:MAG: glycine--tRNA ligase subunit beta [Pisciglobus halotolerans]|nr:glycine--tRNA ligase subunit beta [Pisciglobus halotolerans]